MTDVAAGLAIVPANEASWEDLQAVFGTHGDPPRCQCQRYKLAAKESWRSVGREELARRFSRQTACGQPDAPRTTGLVAVLDGDPVGWCAVEPRSAYHGLRQNFRVHWQGRTEDKLDDTVWAVTCFVVRAGYRGRGITYALARGAVEFARDRGARAIEGYPMLVRPRHVTWGELHVGKPSVFEAAGLAVVARPSKRRLVMRIDFS